MTPDHNPSQGDQPDQTAIAEAMKVIGGQWDAQRECWLVPKENAAQLRDLLASTGREVRYDQAAS